MRAPRLNRRMSLEERVEVPNGSGGFSRTWVEVAELWVGVLGGAGAEVFQAGTALGRVRCRILLRAGGPRPAAGQRFREMGRVFTVRALWEADPDARYLTCDVEEEVPA